jgi:predicted CXXCH cytochrome family protein
VTPVYAETKHAKATGEDPRHTTDGKPGVGCQICHGPGVVHAKAKPEEKKGTSHQPIQIETREGRLSLCARCHAQYDEGFVEDYTWGDNILDKITLKEPTGGLLEQVNEMKDSLHFTSTKGTNPVCIDCHTGHKGIDENLPHQIRKPITELCNGCHGAEVADALHCQQEIPPDGTCGTCHMPERKHVFKVAAP